jgi:hypothetical protein
MADDPTDPSTEPEATEPSAEDVVAEDTAPADPDPSATPATPAAKAADKVSASPKPKPGTPGAAKDSTVVRKKVTSKRVTPKGSPQGLKSTPPKGSTPARTKGDDGEDLGYSKRYAPPEAKYAPGPSPWWVPAIMFTLLIVGALIIMLNYMGVFGDADNIRLVIGLAFILGGIITATQYR